MKGGEPAFSTQPYELAQIPEPATLFLVGIGLGYIGLLKIGRKDN